MEKVVGKRVLQILCGYVPCFAQCGYVKAGFAFSLCYLMMSARPASPYHRDDLAVPALILSSQCSEIRMF